VALVEWDGVGQPCSETTSLSTSYQYLANVIDLGSYLKVGVFHLEDAKEEEESQKGGGKPERRNRLGDSANKPPKSQGCHTQPLLGEGSEEKDGYTKSRPPILYFLRFLSF